MQLETANASLSLAQEYALALIERAELALVTPGLTADLTHHWKMEIIRARKIFNSRKRA